MTTQTIDAARALDLLRQAVAQDGYGDDYVYPYLNDCQYVRNSAPSCLVGHALHLGGWSVDALDGLINTPVRDAVRIGFTSLDKEAANVFDLAQVVQDQGGTWGEALRAAEAMAR